MMSAVALDCEMVGSGSHDLPAKVSIVDETGGVLLDTYVKPNRTVTDYREIVSGVDKQKLQFGKSFESVQREVSRLLDGNILVGHSLHFDLKALELSHPEKYTRDLSKYRPYMKDDKPQSLKTLASTHLGKTIQQGSHDSLEDATIAMELYKLVAHKW